MLEIAGMAGNGWKGLEMNTGNCWKWLEMAGMAGTDFKCLKMAVNG